ncbi:MAG TPA: hypothetical protein VMU50_19700 [Polyangia bacterium]|nr:hypothetical protein [Polyangia bacterium]
MSAPLSPVDAAVATADDAEAPAPAPVSEHTHALEASAWARSSSRLLLLVGGITYVSWHCLHKLVQPAAVDPLGERLGFLAFIFALVAASYHRALNRHLVAMGYAVVAVGTAHYFSLVVRNDVSPSYTIGMFVLLGGVSTLLVSPRAVFGYAAYSVAAALVTVAVASGAPLEDRLELLAGTITVQVGLCVSAWRNSILRNAVTDLEKAKREIRQLRGLLPICMHCNRIRDRGNSWKQFETYVEEHTDAAFTHSLCRECAEKHYPGV